MEIVLFLAGAIGLAHILVDGKICQPLRDWLGNPTLPYWVPRRVKDWLDYPTLPWWIGFLSFIPRLLRRFVGWLLNKCHEMIHCHQCAGLWAGLAVGWLVFSNLNFWQWLACGFAGSFVSMFIAIYYNYLESQTIVGLPPEPNQNEPPK